MTQYRITGATKTYQKSNYQIQKRSWYWPFWVGVGNHTYETVRDAEQAIDIYKTDIRL